MGRGPARPPCARGVPRLVFAPPTGGIKEPQRVCLQQSALIVPAK
jgi:hypothetical protein